MRKWILAGLAMVALATPSRAEDKRQMVEMPAMMQDHMLASMRDHLVVLGDILAAVSSDRYGVAADLAETRLGLSSFGLHDASHMAPYMPKGMQEAGGSLHRAASRFALVARDTDVARTYDSMRNLAGAIAEMAAACNSCHVGYRIR